MGSDDQREPNRPAARRLLPLRVRTMVAFGAIGLVLATTLATVCFVVTRSTLIDQRQATAERQTFLNARAVKVALEAGSDPATALEGVQTSSGGAALLSAGEDWYATSVAVGRRQVPASLADTVNEGHAGHQRLELAGEPTVAVGVDLPGPGARYFEFVPLNEVANTLDRLRTALVLAAVVVTVLSVLAGRVASRRILQPVQRMSRAANVIREGALDRRLDSEGDADLEPLVVSFNRMVDGLAERIEREARFASDVSHELRSPLATMDAALSVARRRIKDEAAVEALDVLGDEVGKFSHLVTDLLEISRAEAGIAELHRETVSADELVASVLASTDRQHLDLQVEGKGALVLVDRRRFAQALINILNNADNYAGGATAVRVTATSDRVRFDIDDDGPGIPVHERFHVFERFARGSTSDRPGAGPGTGLGLSLVAEHVRLHGGTIAVETSPSGGARFTIELPRVER